MEAFVEHIRALPGGLVIAPFALLVAIVELLALRAARRGSATAGRWLRAGAAGVVLVAAGPGVAVQVARATFARAFVADNPGEKARLLSDGIGGQINGLAFGAFSTSVVLALWLVALQLRPARGEAAPPAPAAHRPLLPLLALGFASTAAGVLAWSTLLIKAFASIAGVPPEQKVPILAEALRVGRAALETYSRMSSYTIVGLTVLVALLTTLGRGRKAAPPPLRRSLAGAAAALALAAGLVAAARPLRAENETPWPAPAEGEVLNVIAPKTPDVDGPDPIERAPVVQIFADQLALDGSEVTPEELRETLGTLRDNYSLLHPNERFVPETIVLAGASVTGKRARAVLKILHGMSYERTLLTFTRAEKVERPIFGTLRRVHGSAARVALVNDWDVDARDDPAGGREGQVLRVERFADYDGLAREVVRLRRAGEAVVLNIGK